MSEATDRRRTWWWGHLVLPVIAVAALTLVFELTPLDLMVDDLFYDEAAHRWIGAGQWWDETLIHRYGRHFVASIALVLLCGLVLSIRLRQLRRWRKALGYGLLCMLLSTGIVSLGKRLTNMDCPRDLQPYGGRFPYIHLFEDRPDHLPPGHCFPGGHSSGGFSLLFLYFLLGERDRRMGLAGLALALGLGSVYAVGQWARGAHFPSHDMWSAFIAWMVALGLYHGPFGGRVLPESVRREGAA